MKIIHSADWHLGRILHNQSLLNDQAYILDQLIELIKTQQVDVLLIAGDVYDRSLPPADAVALLDDVINQLVELNVTVIMISGNHDGPERLSFASRQLQQAGVHILGDLKSITKPIDVQKDDLKVHFYGIPYADPEKVRDAFANDVKTFDEAHTFLVEEIKSQYQNSVNNVLLSHCFVDGAKTSDSEKTLSIGGSDRVSFEPLVDFDYVALGHLHSPQKRGAEHIRYSGSLLKYSFSEHQQKKGVTLLEFDQSGLIDQQHLTLRPQKELRVITGLLDEVLALGKTDPNNEDYVMVSLTDQTALLDPMSKLRVVYPNVLHLEKVLLTQALGKTPDREIFKRGESEMIHDFFQQVTGQDLTTEQADIVSSTLQQLLKSEEA